MSDPLSTQYAALSERRLHFGRMYWQNIGLHCAGLLFAAAFFRDLTGVALSVALVIAGAATLLIAFIASRLRALEVAYETKLGAIEDAWIAQGHAGVQKAPVSGQGGARSLVNLALAGAGGALVIGGAIVALNPG